MIHKIHRYSRASYNGFVGAEWIISITILLLVVSVGQASLQRYTSNHYALQSYARELALSLKEAQLNNMMGRITNESLRSVLIKTHSYEHRSSSKAVPNTKVELPSHIVIIGGTGEVFFNGNGLPDQLTRIILEDTITKEKVQVIIAVQTGRIRCDMTGVG